MIAAFYFSISYSSTIHTALHALLPRNVNNLIITTISFQIIQTINNYFVIVEFKVGWDAQ